MEIGGIWKAFLEDRPQLSMHFNESLLLASTIDELTFALRPSEHLTSPPPPLALALLLKSILASAILYLLHLPKA
jgi:hypothetical protein